VGSDLVGKASVGVLAVVGVDPAILDVTTGGGSVSLLTDIVLVVFAGVARLAGIDVIADANMISDLRKTRLVKTNFKECTVRLMFDLKFKFFFNIYQQGKEILCATCTQENIEKQVKKK
jgi:hypothetical protein